MLDSFQIGEALTKLNGVKRILICPHDNPDPDALASAWAMSTLLKHELEAETTVAFAGIIGRAENRAMVRELNIKLRRLEGIDATEYDGVFYVDTQPSAQNHSVPLSLPVLGCVDHHPGVDNGDEVPWFDVRPDGETTSAIALSYLVERGIEVEPPLATAILYALKTDTRDFSREATDDDISAFNHVFPIADRRALGAILHPQLEPRYFNELSAALQVTRLDGPVASILMPELLYPDLIAEIADLIVRRRGTDWCLTGGRYGDELRFSLRTEIEKGRAGGVARKLVRKYGGSAGGHGMSAGGTIPLTEANSSRTVEEIWAEVLNVLLKVLKVEPTGTPLLCEATD